MKKLLFLAALCFVSLMPSYLHAQANPKRAIKVTDLAITKATKDSNGTVSVLTQQGPNELWDIIGSTAARVELNFNLLDISSSTTFCSRSSMTITALNFGPPTITYTQVGGIKTYTGKVSLFIRETGRCCNGVTIDRQIKVSGWFSFQMPDGVGSLFFTMPATNNCRPVSNYLVEIRKR